MSQHYSPQQKNYYEITILRAKRKEEVYFKRLSLFFILVLVVGGYYLWEHRPESISSDKAFIALCMTGLSFLPSLQYLLDRKRPPIPFFPLVGIFYATSFGLPIFATDVKSTNEWTLTDVSEPALTLVLLGILGMIIAFYTSKYSLWKKVSPLNVHISCSQRKFINTIWLVFLFYIATINISWIGSLPSVGQLAAGLGYLAYGIFYILWSRRQITALQLLIFIGISFPFDIIKRFASGLLAEVMILGLFMTIIVWYERKRIPIFLICMTMLIYSTFAPVKAEYRVLTWGGQLSQLNPIERASVFIDLAVKHYQKDTTSSNSQDSANRHLVERSAHIVTFERVFRDTPTKVPYWNGYTYSQLLTSLIPRALWPDKPQQMIGNEFGQRYHYLDKNDKSTSYNLPWIVEMYVNFGNSGVLIGMSLVGVFLAFLEQKYNSPGIETLEVVIGATILFPLVYQETNFSLLVGNLLNMTLALYLMFRFLLGSQHQKSV